MGGLRPLIRQEILNMQEKFLKLPKGLRFLILTIVWIITVGCLAGCTLIKSYFDIIWLEIILTCIGMFAAVVAICLTIYQVTAKEVTISNK